ncbi:hypothetical protein C8J57DRAFT_1322891 [Mycena rebaudengoi]|nr:hypothetical protein C8J57DRAFT_1322891 [Mycena rebaudengoi]
MHGRCSASLFATNVGGMSIYPSDQRRREPRLDHSHVLDSLGLFFIDVGLLLFASVVSAHFRFPEDLSSRNLYPRSSAYARHQCTPTPCPLFASLFATSVAAPWANARPSACLGPFSSTLHLFYDSSLRSADVCFFLALAELCLDAIISGNQADTLAAPPPRTTCSTM